MQGCACSDDAGKPENRDNAAIAPAVERTLGKGEVACSNHAGSTIFLHIKSFKALLHKRLASIAGASYV